jgi:hypothetical protein
MTRELTFACAMDRQGAAEILITSTRKRGCGALFPIRAPDLLVETRYNR